MSESTPAPARKESPRGTILAVTLGMLLCAVMIASTSSVGKRAMARWQVEDTLAPAITLPELRTGAPVSTQDHLGKVVVLDFWATWCPPCVKQMPIIERLATDPSLAGDLTVLSINTDEHTPERPKLVQGFLTRRELTMTTLLDDGRASQAYRVFSIPTLVVLDRQGKVSALIHGLHSEQELRAAIAEAMK